MKPSIPFACALLLVLLTVSACGQAADFSSAVSGTVLFQDSLDGSSSGWGLWNTNEAVVKYDEKGGGLRIAVTEPQYDFWSLAGKDFADAQIEVDTTRLSGTEDNDYGIICRYVDKDNFYAFLISSDGYYGIVLVKDGAYTLLGAEKLKFSEVIAHGESHNHLQADCDGTSLRLSVNGHLLHETTDDTFQSGDVGLLAGTYEVGNIDILFHNFVVKKP